MTLPPVRQPVHLASGGEAPPAFPGYRALWTASGTSALAIALECARRRHAEVRRPKVLLPAYGCPNLVAAAVFAGTEPRLVDIRSDDPGFDDEALGRAWDEDVVAAVAVDFLGIRERIGPLLELARARGGMVVEDCAQAFPERGLSADAVVLSFGRGKPVNLLGGGALFLADGDERCPRLRPKRANAAAFWLEAAAFNVTTHRAAYGWLSRLPGLHVGATRYERLRSVEGLDAVRLQRLGTNVAAWLERPRWREAWLSERLSRIPGVLALPHALEGRAGRLLRYPVLMPDRAARDRVFGALHRKGLGASKFYAAPLTGISGVPAEVRAQGEFPAARGFADRLITLPVHDGVNREDLRSIADVLEVTAP